MSMSDLTLNIELNGEVREFQGWLKEGADPTMQSLYKVICELFGIRESHLFEVRYHNEMGSLCTLIGATLPDALDIAKTQSNVLRLTCSVKQDSIATPKAACADAVATVGSGYSVVGEESKAGTAVQESEIRSQCEDSSPMPRATSSSAISAADEAASGTRPSVESVPGREIESRWNMAQRFQRCRPQLAEGFSNFKQQIVSDFQTTRDDMKGAFVANQDGEASERQQPATVRKISNVTSNVAGAVVACRLLPVRAIRLAAHGVSAMQGANDCSDTVSQVVVEEPKPAAASSVVAADTASQVIAMEPEPAATSAAMAQSSENTAGHQSAQNRRSGFDHLWHQIKGDFQTTREEINASFQSVLGNSNELATTDTAAASTGSTVQHRPSAKEIIPKVASTIAGCTVAAGTAPVHTVRFAVESVASRARRGTGDPVDLHEASSVDYHVMS